MYDVEIHMKNQPGELAAMGEALGEAGINVEGGGMFLIRDVGVAHVLFDDGIAASQALSEAGMSVVKVREVVTARLRQDEAGQLGKICRAMADAGVNIELLYSDHDGRLILLVDDVAAGRRVSDEWMAGRTSGQ